MNLRLSHKGLFLVCSILALELVLIGVLMHLMTEVERQGILEEHSKEVVGKTNEIFQLIYDAGTTADRYLKFEKPQDQELFQNETMRLSQKLLELKPLLQGQPSQLERVQEVEKDSNRGFGMLGNLMQQVRTEGHEAAAINELRHIGEMRSLQSHVMNDLRLLMQEQGKLVKDSFAQRIESLNEAKKWMVGGVVLNVIAALGAALFFTKGVTSRLQVMVDNTVSLGKGDPLKPPIGGTDEIAQLDETFHHMADALAESARRRRELVAMIAHDLRTPLTSVQGFLSILSRGGYGEVSENMLDRSKMAEFSTSRLISMINDLLDLEQLESGKMMLQLHTVSSKDIVERSVDSLIVVAEQKKIDIEAPSQHYDLCVDESRIVRVLVNLISNAIKFSEAGKSIKVSVVPVDRMIEFAVTDQGCGISAADQSNLFVAFHQLNPREDSKHGSGLGLAICKAITEQHGGTIGVISKVGEGSRFWFRVPIASP